MTCDEFLDGFSEYHDSDATAPRREVFEAHLRACASCARYRDVVERGVALLRSIPSTPIRDDFRDRLRHSIYQHEEERRRAGMAPGAFRFMAAVAAAAVLAVLAGGSFLRGPEPAVELAPIVVQRSVEPAPSRFPLPSGPVGVSAEAPRLEALELWESPNALLYRHSSLYQRDREPGLVRTGLR